MFSPKKKQEEKRTPMDKKISKQSVKAQSLAQRSYAETTRFDVRGRATKTRLAS